jgi:hypothetical protein
VLFLSGYAAAAFFSFCVSALLVVWQLPAEQGAATRQKGIINCSKCLF